MFTRYCGVTAAVVAAVALSGCTGPSQADLERARREGAQAQAETEAAKRQQEAQASLAAEVQRLKDEAAKSAAAQSSTASAAATTSCGANLSVNSKTSCAFGENVRAAFYQAGGGNVTIDVYSPVTGRYHRMSCQAGVPTVCRGGNDAVVHVR